MKAMEVIEGRPTVCDFKPDPNTDAVLADICEATEEQSLVTVPVQRGSDAQAELREALQEVDCPGADDRGRRPLKCLSRAFGERSSAR